jgi:hypothetical protein
MQSPMNDRAAMRNRVFTGQGLGARMLGRLEGLAIGLGIRAVTLKASLNAVGFYLGAGYTARESGWHVTDSGLRLACVHMEKSLARPATSNNSFR